MTVKQQSISQRVHTLRAQITALQAERVALRERVRSTSEVREHVERQVARWAEEADKQLRRDLAAAGTHRAVAMLLTDVDEGGLSLPSTVNLGPVLTLVLGEEVLKARILSRLDAVAECPDSAQRVARVEAIGRELDRLEAEEEGLIVESEESGDAVLRRGDARPEIVLGTRDFTLRIDPETYLVGEAVSVPFKPDPEPPLVSRL